MMYCYDGMCLEFYTAGSFLTVEYCIDRDKHDDWSVLSAIKDVAKSEELWAKGLQRSECCKVEPRVIDIIAIGTGPLRTASSFSKPQSKMRRGEHCRAWL